MQYIRFCGRILTRPEFYFLIDVAFTLKWRIFSQPALIFPTGECSFYVHLVSNTVVQNFSHADAKRKQKNAKLNNSPVKTCNLNILKGKVILF